jgi:hypothetical protein
MAEFEHTIDNVGLGYTGLCNVTELYKLVNNWISEHGYDKKELRNIEQTIDNKRYIKIIMQPFKKVTDYIEFSVWIFILGEDLEKVTIERKGVKETLDKGTLNIKFHAFLTSDYFSKWEDSAGKYLIRLLFEKFVFHTYMLRYRKQVVEDFEDLQSKIKQYLNLYRNH